MFYMSAQKNYLDDLIASKNARTHGGFAEQWEILTGYRTPSASPTGPASHFSSRRPVHFWAPNPQDQARSIVEMVLSSALAYVAPYFRPYHPLIAHQQHSQ
jgi:hypothetical protein